MGSRERVSRRAGASRGRLAGSLAAVVVLLGLAALPAGAGAKGPSGLACLQGSWISNGIQSSAASGLSGIRLTVSGGGAATANYDYSSPIRFTGSSFSVYIRGSSWGRFRYLGHGRYAYTRVGTSERASTYFVGSRVSGPTPVKLSATAAYNGLRCTAGRLTDVTVVSTKHGQVAVGSSFRRAG
jgi:hypothetical protein